MFLDIISPDKLVFSGEIKLVQLPGSNGQFEILKNHAPVISTLETGKIKVITDTGEQLFFDISGGVVEFNKNKTIILVEA